MFGRELNLLDTLIHGPNEKIITREEYVLQLAERMEFVYEQLRYQLNRIREADPV